MAARYRHFYGPFGKACLQAPFMMVEMQRRAEAIKTRAIELSPVRSGRYAASFSVQSGIRRTGSPRAYGRVTNTAPYASAVEYGFGKTPKYRVLGRAAGL